MVGLEKERQSLELVLRCKPIDPAESWGDRFWGGGLWCPVVCQGQAPGLPRASEGSTLPPSCFSLQQAPAPGQVPETLTSRNKILIFWPQTAIQDSKIIVMSNSPTPSQTHLSHHPQARVLSPHVPAAHTVVTAPGPTESMASHANSPPRRARVPLRCPLFLREAV